jgi:hypothetical protein
VGVGEGVGVAVGVGDGVAVGVGVGVTTTPGLAGGGEPSWARNSQAPVVARMTPRMPRAVQPSA